MKKINKLSLSFYLLCITLLFSTCRSSKETAGSGLMEKLPKKERIEQIMSQSLSYQTFSASANFNLKPGAKKKNTSIDGQFRIVKGQCIQVSLRLPIIGTELMKIQITPKQITVIDRYNKQYLSEQMATIKRMYPVDFDYYNLEALFTNQLFISGNTHVELSDYNKFDYNEELFHSFLRYIDSQKISYTFKTDYTNHIVETLIGKDNSDTRMMWNYTDFKPIDTQCAFPNKEHILITTSDDEFRLDITFKKIELNKSFTIDYNIPSKYARIDLNQFIKTINGL